MSAHLVFVLTLLAALGRALMAGTFFAFSAFVMCALGRLRPATGIAAMRSINVVVIRFSSASSLEPARSALRSSSSR